MQLITTRNKEISFVELKKAISSGNGLELIRPGDKFAIELKNGELVNAVCGGYVNEKRARFVLEDCLADKWRMNDTPTNKGGYLKSEGRRHVLEDILPLFPDELAEAFEPRFMSEEIDGERHEYADTLWIPSATDVFGAGDWWNEEPDSVQLEIFKRERDRVKGARRRWDVAWVAPFPACEPLLQFRVCEHRRHSHRLQRELFPRLRARL